MANTLQSMGIKTKEIMMYRKDKGVQCDIHMEHDDLEDWVFDLHHSMVSFSFI